MTAPTVGDATPQSFDRVLSSMCTEPVPAARTAAERFLATNPGDPDTYPTVHRLERETVTMLGEIVGLEDPHGYVASGGTEANIQAVRAARNRADSGDPAVVAPESVHFSFQKAADLLGVDLRLATVTGNGRVDVDAVTELIDEDTVLVVGVAGTTEYGRVDPIPALADIATDADVQFHVDAAWGGFVLPFTDVAWNFADAAIDTMTIDPHKAGQAAIPAGGFLAREERALDVLTIETPYLESTSQASLTGTRSGAGVASAHAAIDTQWPEGYRENYDRASDLAAYVTTELRSRGFDVVEPTHPIVAVDLPTRVFDVLTDEGWRLARTAAGETRLVLMPHVTRAMLDAFLADLDAVLERNRDR
ncbi:MAG: tyrosine decarboxylase MfnA [Halanaeroarchaeum sp.]